MWTDDAACSDLSPYVSISLRLWLDVGKVRAISDSMEALLNQNMKILNHSDQHLSRCPIQFDSWFFNGSFEHRCGFGLWEEEINNAVQRI